MKSATGSGAACRPVGPGLIEPQRRHRLPDGFATLFAEFGAPRRDRCLFVTRPVSRQAAATMARQRGAEVLAFQPTVLRTPAWVADPPWLSGTLAHAAGPDGTSRPGWAEAALGTPPSAQAHAAVATILEQRLGATSFGDPVEAARPHVIVPEGGCGAEGLAVAREGLRACLASRDAASALLLLPAGASGKAWSALVAECARMGVSTRPEPGDPWVLLDDCASLYAGADGHWAVLARFAGLDVTCLGEGVLSGPPRPATELAEALLVRGARYADPFDNRPISLPAALDIAAEWHAMGRANRGIAACAGMSRWKRRRIAQFLTTGAGASPRFCDTAAQLRRHAPRGAAVAAWASRIPPGFDPAADGLRLLRVEDGFIRSRGLGSDFLPPCSVVLDSGGGYVDASRPSTLERLLTETVFDPALLERAGALIERLVAGGVTKYAAGVALERAPQVGARRRLLVPGQVADDLSVRLSGCGVDNAGLLRRVRAGNPEAAITYKPHPDVAAGHRQGHVDARVLAEVDAAVTSGGMADLLAEVDEVHTVTSLAGFEALLRRLPVVAYGQPFYAGWGLTRDLVPPPRRGRRLSLEELVAGTLLLYPRYIDPVSGLPCPAEVLVRRLSEPAAWRAGPLVRIRRLQGRVNETLRRLRA